MASLSESRAYMAKMNTSSLPEAIGKELVLGGWVHDIRIKGGIIFIELRDAQGVAQITVKKGTVPEELYQRALGLGKEDVIIVRGRVIKSTIAKAGVEVQPQDLRVVSKAATPLPLDPKAEEKELERSHHFMSDFSTRMRNRTLDLRVARNRLILKVQAALIRGMAHFLEEEGFLQVFTPCIIGGISEGGAEVFRLDYFGEAAFLRQDPQLHRQLLITAGIERLYELGPSWRAEPSHTPRHLCEHRGCAVEMAFIEDEGEVMRLQEALIVAGVKEVIKECSDELRKHFPSLELRVPTTPFPELRFPEIYDILKERGRELPYGEDYGREEEPLLYEYVKERYGSDFFFVNRFPSKAKPFYVMYDEEDPRWARSVDLLCKWVEVSSGGQREHRLEHRLERLLQQMRERGIDLEGMRWFTEPFRYGVPPHGGFNLGIERLTTQLLGLSNIREATPFYRDPEHLLP